MEGQFKPKKINFYEEIKTVPNEVLLKIGKRIASVDYEVRGFTNKKAVGLYQNRELLLTAVRRAYGNGAFNHREQAMRILTEYLEEECNKRLFNKTSEV